jgi:drug/metabolite transporter (DMT)-like permease
MKETFGYLLIVVASLLWGTMGVLGELAFQLGIHPATLIALRMLISFLTVLAFAVILKREAFRIQKRDVFLFLIFGIFAVAIQRVTYFYALDFSTVTMAAILFYTYPIFVTIYSGIVLKEKVSFSTIVAIVLTFFGVALVVKVYEAAALNANFYGIVFGLLSSVLFALYFLLTKKLRHQYSNWSLMVYGDGIGALILTPVIFSNFSEISVFPQQLWFIILTVAWIPSLLAYFIYSYALKSVQSSKGSILSVLEPLAATALSAAILKENFEPLQLIGVMLALTGVILLFYRRKQGN